MFVEVYNDTNKGDLLGPQKERLMLVKAEKLSLKNFNLLKSTVKQRENLRSFLPSAGLVSQHPSLQETLLTSIQPKASFTLPNVNVHEYTIIIPELVLFCL